MQQRNPLSLKSKSITIRFEPLIKEEKKNNNQHITKKSPKKDPSQINFLSSIENFITKSAKGRPFRLTVEYYFKTKTY